MHFELRPAPALSEAIVVYEPSTARILVNDAVVWETSRDDMLFGFLFGAINHRGQLSTYLRSMGGRVPSFDGPSADDSGM